MGMYFNPGNDSFKKALKGKIADLAFIPLKTSNKPPMIIELKYDKTADSAIRQIKEKRYHGALEGFGNEILLVGINYDKEGEGKKHTCIIESVSGTN